VHAILGIKITVDLELSEADWEAFAAMLRRIFVGCESRLTIQ
jgi:hypothetical protein